MFFFVFALKRNIEIAALDEIQQCCHSKASIVPISVDNEYIAEDKNTPMLVFFQYCAGLMWSFIVINIIYRNFVTVCKW